LDHYTPVIFSYVVCFVPFELDMLTNYQVCTRMTIIVFFFALNSLCIVVTMELAKLCVIF